MLDALSYEFIQNALIAGILVSFIAGIIGSLIVANRIVFFAGGIAHAAYGGIGIAIFTGIPIFLGTSLFAIVAARVAPTAAPPVALYQKETLLVALVVIVQLKGIVLE